MVLYTCIKCNKGFNNKHNYIYHINKKYPCTNESVNLKNQTIDINSDEFSELQEENKILKEQIKILESKNIILENENKTINELYKNLLDKCLITNKKLSKNNCHNTNNSNNTNNNTTNNNTTNNNTTNNNSNNSTINNNTINLNLVPFGMENLDDLTLEEKKSIVNSGLYCSVVCTKKINCNPRLPQYHNISYTNLRSNDAKIYDKDKTWKTIDKEDLFETIIPRRLDDINNIIENQDIQVSPYINNLLEKGTDEDKILNDNKIKKKFHRTIYDFNKSKTEIKNKLI
jgi:hypothetical protein